MKEPKAAGLLGSFVLASCAMFVLTTNVFGDLAHPTRFSAILLVLIAIHALRYLRLWIGREVITYLLFAGYLLLSLSWTRDIRTAQATLPSIANFALVLILFGSLAAYHHRGAMLTGLLAGFLAAAAVYTLTTGFPLRYPEDFSYNTIAAMYFCGLFITAIFGAVMRWTILPLAIGAILLVLIAATTSIKTNLGIALGVTLATLLYFRGSPRVVIRSLVLVCLSAGAIGYAVTANQALNERVRDGLARVATGIAVLTNREGDSGATGLGNREGWKNAGLKGWAESPVFGHGVEGFRAEFGITSHSTPIDLLYNSGLIGFGLFYAMLASIASRLLQARDAASRGLRARIAGCLIAYTFISISGLLYYDAFFAVFVAVSAGLLMQAEHAAGHFRWRQELHGSARTSPSVL